MRRLLTALLASTALLSGAADAQIKAKKPEAPPGSFTKIPPCPFIGRSAMAR